MKNPQIIDSAAYSDEGPNKENGGTIARNPDGSFTMHAQLGCGTSDAAADYKYEIETVRYLIRNSTVQEAPEDTKE